MTNAPILGANAPILGAVGEETTLADALFGKTRRVVLGLLFGHPEEGFYMRQISRILNLGQGALLRELQRLTAAGILLREAHGRQVYYRANKACPIYTDLQGLLLKTVGLADVLRAALAPLAEKIEVAFVYGSMAKGTAQAGSDVDVMVIGAASFAEVVAALNATQDTLRREVNPSSYPPEEVRSKFLAGHHFLKAVLSEPKLFLIGDEDDFRRLVADGVAGRAQG
jgi:predicted nucleotidyltransferase